MLKLLLLLISLLKISFFLQVKFTINNHTPTELLNQSPQSVIWINDHCFVIQSYFTFVYQPIQTFLQLTTYQSSQLSVYFQDLILTKQLSEGEHNILLGTINYPNSTYSSLTICSSHPILPTAITYKGSFTGCKRRTAQSLRIQHISPTHDIIALYGELSVRDTLFNAEYRAIGFVGGYVALVASNDKHFIKFIGYKSEQNDIQIVQKHQKAESAINKNIISNSVQIKYDPEQTYCFLVKGKIVNDRYVVAAWWKDLRWNIIGQWSLSKKQFLLQTFYSEIKSNRLQYKKAFFINQWVQFANLTSLQLNTIYAQTTVQQLRRGEHRVTPAENGFLLQINAKSPTQTNNWPLVYERNSQLIPNVQNIFLPDTIEQ